MGPMWTPSQILRSLINRGLSATAPADERAAPDEIFARSLPAHGRDERRIPRHDNGVMIGLGCRHEAVSNRCGQLEETKRDRVGEVFRVLIGCRATGYTPGAQKIRRPSSGGGKSRGDFSFERSFSRTSTLWVMAPCHLQRQVAGSGFPNHS